jgi:exopolyphosphatase/pppGpp-phosphohydrolase
VKVAVVDIGAAQLSLSLATVGSEEAIALLGEFSVETNLVADFEGDGPEKVLAGLKNFRHILRQQNGLSRVRVIATSGMPEGAARQGLMREAQQVMDATVEVLDPGDEAAYSFVASHDAVKVDRGSVVLTCEVDGASTHLALGDGRALVDVYTLNLGAVSLARRFLHGGDGAGADASLALSEHLHQLLNVEGILGEVAGRPLSLVAGGSAMSGFVQMLSGEGERGSTHGAAIELDTVFAVFEELMHAQADDAGARAGVPAARVPALTATIGILLFLMEKLEVGEVTVSDHGLRHGALREMLGLTRRFL